MDAVPTPPEQEPEYEIVPAELDPETVAELEDALVCGSMDDVHVVYISQGLHAVWHALGQWELHDAWWPQVDARRLQLMDAVSLLDDVPNEHPEVLAYCDWLRDWVKAAGDATGYWLHSIGVPFVKMHYFGTVGNMLYIELPAKDPS